MTKAEALRIVGKECPCPHETADTRLGNGQIWAKCEDCGATFQQEDWPRHR